MKKLIALILALVLILSMSICVSAVDLPASLGYYIRIHNRPCDTLYVTLYYQPIECSDDVIPEAWTEGYEDFIYHVMQNWGCINCQEVEENLFYGNIADCVGTDNVTGNFIVHIQGDPYSDNPYLVVSDVRTFFNGKNGLDVDLGGEGAIEYIRDKFGYISSEKGADQIIVYGSRGEQVTSGDVVSVDLEWGGMEFVYTPEQTVWNPKTHEYEPVVNEDGSSVSGWSVAEGSSNHIAITNHSNIPVEAVLEFASAEGKEIYGAFDNSVLYCESAAEMAYNSPEKAPSDSTVFNIIRCEIDEETAGDLGTITITIRHREA